VQTEVQLAQLCRDSDCPATFHLCGCARPAALSHCVQWSRLFWYVDPKTGKRVLYDTANGEPVHVGVFSHGLRCTNAAVCRRMRLGLPQPMAEHIDMHRLANIGIIQYPVAGLPVLFPKEPRPLHAVAQRGRPTVTTQVKRGGAVPAQLRKQHLPVHKLLAFVMICLDGCFGLSLYVRGRNHPITLRISTVLHLVTFSATVWHQTRLAAEGRRLARKAL